VAVAGLSCDSPVVYAVGDRVSAETPTTGNTRFDGYIAIVQGGDYYTIDYDDGARHDMHTRQVHAPGVHAHARRSRSGRVCRKGLSKRDDEIVSEYERANKQQRRG